MKEKSCTLRRSSLLRRRIASAVLLMLTFHTAAMAYTVTLNANNGSGDPIVIDSEVSENMAASQSSAAGGQFWMDDDQLWFKFPTCPDTFTAPGDKPFFGWSINTDTSAPSKPGSVYPITGDLTLYAIWELEPFIIYEGNADYIVAVTSYSPLEAKLTQISIFSDEDLAIPATMEYNDKVFTITAIDDGVGNSLHRMTTLTIPATVRYIGNECFSNCNNLTAVTFAEGSQLEALGHRAICNCSSLTSVYGLPTKATFSDGSPLFSYCPLQDITLMGHGEIHYTIMDILSSVQSFQWILPSNTFGDATWTTFYNNDFNFQADGATTVYKAELKESSLQLHEVPDRIINSSTAVILKSTGDPVLTKTEAVSTDNSPNHLLGCERDVDAFSGAYVLYGGAQGLGFYPYNGEYLQGGKAYVYIPSGSGVKGFVGMTETPSVGTTSIPSMPAQNAQEEDAAPWYSIQGLPLPARPTRPGIYIHGGRKVVIP